MKPQTTNTRRTATSHLWIFLGLALVAAGGLVGGCNKGGGAESDESNEASGEDNPNFTKIKARLSPIFDAMAGAAAQETTNCRIQERLMDNALAPFRTQAQEIYTLAQNLQGAERFDKSIINATIREHIGPHFDLAVPHCGIRQGTMRVHAILRPDNKPFDWSLGPFELITVQPPKPGPFGIFGMLKLGMTLKEAYAAQPAFEPITDHLSTDRSYPNGPLRSAEWINLLDDHEAKAGAFPWAWTPQAVSFHKEKTDTELISVLITVEGIAHLVPGTLQYNFDPDKTFLRNIHLIVETKTQTSDTFIQPLTKLWGEPVRGGKCDWSGAPLYLWHNDPEDTCVFLEEKEREDGIRRLDIYISSCQTPAEYLDTILATPKSSNAIIGAQPASFSADRFRTDETKDPVISFRLPDIGHNHHFAENHHITLDANKKITTLSLKHPYKTAIVLDGNSQPMPAHDALAAALKGRVPAEVLAAAKQAPQTHTLDNGLILTLHLPAERSITLTVSAAAP